MDLHTDGTTGNLTETISKKIDVIRITGKRIMVVPGRNRTNRVR